MCVQKWNQGRYTRVYSDLCSVSYFELYISLLDISDDSAGWYVYGAVAKLDSDLKMDYGGKPLS